MGEYNDNHKRLFIDICMGNFRVIDKGILETANTGIWDANHPSASIVITEAFKTAKTTRLIIEKDYKELFGEDVEIMLGSDD